MSRPNQGAAKAALTSLKEYDQLWANPEDKLPGYRQCRQCCLRHPKNYRGCPTEDLDAEIYGWGMGQKEAEFILPAELQERLIACLLAAEKQDPLLSQQVLFALVCCVLGLQVIEALSILKSFRERGGDIKVVWHA